MENVEEMETQISVIENSHKQQILSIHENMQQLVYDCNAIVVTEEDKEAYDKAVELKRLVKKTHVAIESKRKELKQPIIDYGKRLDEFTKTIYEPLKNAELLVKQKMEVYEKRQEEIKLQRKLEEEEKQKAVELIESKLRNLNSILEKINGAKNKSELDGIMNYLESVNLSEFGDKSGDAGFILNQLKLTCSMASRFIESQQDVVNEEPKVEKPVFETVTEEVVYSIPKIDEMPVNQPQVFHSSEEEILISESPNLFTENETIKEEEPTIHEEPLSDMGFQWDIPKIETSLSNQEIEAISKEIVIKSELQISNAIYGIEQNCSSLLNYYYPELKDSESIIKIKYKVKELFGNQLITTHFKSINNYKF